MKPSVAVIFLHRPVMAGAVHHADPVGLERGVGFTEVDAPRGAALPKAFVAGRDHDGVGEVTEVPNEGVKALQVPVTVRASLRMEVVPVPEDDGALSPR